MLLISPTSLNLSSFLFLFFAKWVTHSDVVCSSQLVRDKWPGVAQLINAILEKLMWVDRKHVNYSDRDHCVTHRCRHLAWAQTHIWPMTNTHHHTGHWYSLFIWMNPTTCSCSCLQSQFLVSLFIPSKYLV